MGSRTRGSVTADSLKEVEYRPRMKLLLTLASQTCLANEYVDAIVQEVKSVVLAERCSIFFSDEVREELWCIPPDAEPFSISRNCGIVGKVAKSGETIHTADARAHDDFDEEVDRRVDSLVRSVVCIPIKHSLDAERTVGVIEVVNKQGFGADRGFSVQDLKVCEDIARLIRDSFYRHRWKALESLESKGDQAAMALISQTHVDKDVTVIGEKASQGANLEGEKALETRSVLGWVDTPLPDNRVVSIAQMRLLSFNVLDCTGEQLTALVEPTMQHTGCVERCKVPLEKLRNWAHAAKKLYRDNSFHNWYHGFSCFQMCYYQLYTSSLAAAFTTLDVFALLIATLCHDLDHPGFTNAFLIDTSSPLALRHNDISVLENHHANLACELLRRAATSIVSGLDDADQKVLRRSIIRCILDTDMAHHGQMVQKLQGATNMEDKQLMMSACIHTCDLSAQVMPWSTACQWEEMISAEFVNQAHEERAAGRTPLPFMDFSMEDLKLRGKLQRDFLDFVLVPLWDPFTQLIPELRPCFRNLIKNRAHYHHRHLKGEDPSGQSTRAKRLAF